MATVEASLKNGANFPRFLTPEMVPTKDIRFDATLHNDHDDYFPAFARLRFQAPSANGKTVQKLRNLKPCRNPCKNHAKTRTNFGNPSQMFRNPAETHGKPCGNPRKLAENLRKPSENPSETLRKSKKPLHSPSGN